MGRLTDDMARIQQDVKSRVSITSTQLAEFKLSRASDTARDSRERAMFVVENSLSVNRMLKEYHDSRIANGQQDRADRIAFVSDMVKKRAEFQEKLSATRAGLLKDMTNKSAAKIADNATSAAVLIKEGTGHTNSAATGKLTASQQPKPAMDAGIGTSEMNAAPVTPKAAAPVTPKAAAPVTPKAAAPVTLKAAAPATPKAAAPVTSKAAAPVTSKAAAPVTSKAAAPVTPKAAAPVTPKAAAPVTPKAAVPGTPKADIPAPVTSRAAEPVAPKAAEPATARSAAPVTDKASAPKRVKSRRNR
jgi:hypothetical protein